jgi:hypothetical protein
MLGSSHNPTPQTAGCGRACPGAQLASQLPSQQRHRKASWTSLTALFLPGVLFGAGLVLLQDHPQFGWLQRVADYPWQLWTLALSGCVATVAGFGDWAYHRWTAHCVVGRAERNCELLALVGGGLPMFVLMSLASLSPRPLQLLLPVILVLIFTATLICYDEFIFHRRRCRRLETVLHRLLVFGNGTAWLAWAHWCFVERASHA